MRERGLVVVASVLLLSGWLAGGCAGGVVSNVEPDGDGGAGGATTGTGTTTGGGGGTTSSTTGSSSTTTTEWPCGIDCGTIQTDDCHVAECNPASKQCEVKNAAGGSACEDGLFCTIDDVCQDGICVGGPSNDCGAKPQVCLDVVCNEVSKSCSTVPQPNSTPCIAADLCQVSSTCQNGVCAGAPKDCFFAPVPDECHKAECNPQNGQCEPVPDPAADGKPCVDSKDLCTVGKQCASGVCGGGAPKDCSALSQGCNVGVCDVNNGQCTTKAVMQGQGCDDLDACTTGETCQNGMCGGGTPVTQCSGNTSDKCCPQGCTEQNDTDCGGFNPALFPIALSPSSYGLGDIDIDGNGDLVAVTGQPRNVWLVNRLTGKASIIASNACGGTYLLGIAFRPGDGLLYVSDATGGLCSVTYGGTVTQVTSLGAGANALVIAPPGFGAHGGKIIAAFPSGRIAAIDPVGPTVTDITLSAGATSALAFGPTGVLYAAGGGSVRTVTAGGTVTPFASGFGSADGVAVDPDNSRLFVADSGGDTIKQVTIPGAAVTTLFAANIDDGYYVSGIIHDKLTTLVYATGEQNYTLNATTP